MREVWVAIVIAFFTISTSVGGAYTLFASNDAVTDVKLGVVSKQVSLMQVSVDQNTKQNNMLYVEISKLRDMTNRLGEINSKMDATLTEFSRSTNKLSTAIARLDERMKTLEKGN